MLMVLALLGMPLGAGSMPLITTSLAVFFLGYFGYYTPYYALFPDLVPPAFQGRSQASRGFSFSGPASGAGQRRLPTQPLAAAAVRDRSGRGCCRDRRTVFRATGQSRP